MARQNLPSAAPCACYGKKEREEISRAGYGTIAGFMLVLQNAFAAMLAAFVLVLFVIVLIVLSHSVSSTVETERKNTGILKSVGFSEHALQRVQLMQYGTAVLPALLLGFLFAGPVARFLMQMTLTTTGILSGFNHNTMNRFDKRRQTDDIQF